MSSSSAIFKSGSCLSLPCSSRCAADRASDWGRGECFVLLHNARDGTFYYDSCCLLWPVSSYGALWESGKMRFGTMKSVFSLILTPLFVILVLNYSADRVLTLFKLSIDTLP